MRVSQRKNWSKPSKAKIKKVAKAITDNPMVKGAPEAPSDDGGAAKMSALRVRNQTSTPGKAQKIIKARRA